MFLKVFIFENILFLSNLLNDVLHFELGKKCRYSELFWSECGEMRTRITLNADTFRAVLVLEFYLKNGQKQKRR